MIKEEFLEALKKYISQEEQQQSMWKEVEEHYTQPDHTLHHLNSRSCWRRTPTRELKALALQKTPSTLWHQSRELF